MTPQRFALLIGSLLMLAGVVLGLAIPVSVTGDVGNVSCGAPWSGSTPIQTNQLLSTHPTDYRALCTSARQTRGTVAIVLVALGGVTAAGSLIATRKPAATHAEPSAA